MRYLIFLLLLCSQVFGQKTKDRLTLEREKKANLLKIAKVNKILNETKKEKEVSLDQIKIYNEQILNQEKKIALAKDEIEITGFEINSIKKTQNQLFEKLSKLQADYAEVLYKESKNVNQLNSLSFLFSSGSLSELFLRFKYLEQYTQDKKDQLKKIQEVGAQLKERQNALLSKKQSQQKILGEIATEAKSLESLKENQNKLLGELSSKETQLKSELEKSKKALSSLNTLISSVISKDQKRPGRKRSEEFEKRERELLAARKKKNSTSTPENSTGSLSSSKEESPKISSGRSFGNSKNRLIWPVEGFISDRFGVKNHPVLKGLKIDNNGIDIKTSPNANVKSVYSGTVLDISNIPGLNNVVAIQHGEYYTVYANLEQVNVHVNQTLEEGQSLGTVATKDGKPEINFQIWHNFTKLNPEHWLGSK
jgi:murein hydrolase activator